MKTLKDVCKRLEGRYSDLVDAYRFNGETAQDILTYSMFETLMMADGWILSDTTVSQKWKLLKKNEIIKEITPSKAIVNGDKLSLALGYESYTDTDSAQKKIKKNFSEEEARA